MQGEFRRHLRLSHFCRARCPHRATGPWLCKNSGSMRFHDCAWLCRSGGGWCWAVGRDDLGAPLRVVSQIHRRGGYQPPAHCSNALVGATLAVARNTGRSGTGPYGIHRTSFCIAPCGRPSLGRDTCRARPPGRAAPRMDKREAGREYSPRPAAIRGPPALFLRNKNV